jgi:hypothetical protein
MRHRLVVCPGVTATNSLDHHSDGPTKCRCWPSTRGVSTTATGEGSGNAMGTQAGRQFRVFHLVQVEQANIQLFSPSAQAAILPFAASSLLLVLLLMSSMLLLTLLSLLHRSAVLIHVNVALFSRLLDLSLVFILYFRGYPLRMWNLPSSVCT